MPDVVAEKNLVDAAVAGDTAAVEQLLLTYYSQLQRHVEQKYPDRARRYFGVDDILQVVFSQVFLDIAGFIPRGDGSFFAWLRTIADHRLIDALRKIDHGEANRVSLSRLRPMSSLADLIDNFCDDSDSPSKVAREQEVVRALQIAIAGLPADQQEVIQLNFLEQKTVEQIANETGRTEAAVRGLVHRGKKNLRDALGRSSRWLSGR